MQNAASGDQSNHNDPEPKTDPTNDLVEQLQALYPNTKEREVDERTLPSSGSNVRKLIGKGEFKLEPISTLPRRFTAKSFGSTDLYLYSTAPAGAFTNAETLIRYLHRRIDEDIIASTSYLYDDGSMAYERDYVNPNKLGFPLDECTTEKVNDTAFRDTIIEQFTPTRGTGTDALSFTVTTYDDPTVAYGREDLLEISRKMPDYVSTKFNKRFDAYYQSGKDQMKHLRPKVRNENIYPVMDSDCVVDIFTTVSASTAVLADTLYEMASLSFRPLPFSVGDASIQTGANINRMNTTGPFITNPQPATLTEDISWYFRSLLTPGCVLLDIDFEETADVPALKAANVILLRFLCMFSEDNMFSNVTRESARVMNNSLKDVFRQHNQGKVPNTDWIFPYMNAFTSDTTDDPLQQIYPHCMRRKNYFVECDDDTVPEAAENATSGSTVLGRIRQQLKSCNIEKSVKDILPMIILRLARFFIEWNQHMKTAWYTNLRPGATTYNTKYDDYFPHAQIYSIKARHLLYILRVLTKGTLICRASSDDYLRIEIGLTYEVTMAAYRKSLIDNIINFFQLKESFSMGDQISLMLQDLPFLQYIYTSLSINGTKESILSLTRIDRLDARFQKFFARMFDMKEARLLRLGVMYSAIANEENFKITKDIVNDRITRNVPYKNVHENDINLDPKKGMSFAAMYDLAVHKGFEFWKDNLGSAVYLNGFFPINCSMSPPSTDGVFPLEFHIPSRARRDFGNSVHVIPLTAYTVVFDPTKFLYEDDYVFKTGNRVKASIPGRIHRELVCTTTEFFTPPSMYMVRQSVVSADPFSFRSIFEMIT